MFSLQIHYDFELRKLFLHNNGFETFWNKFSNILPKVFEQNGELIITKFDSNPEIKAFLLLLKLLVPSNYKSKDMGPITDNLFQIVSVSKIK